MSTPRHRSPSLQEEHGQVMVLFAVLLPLILLIGVISVDLGNWWVHRRHLQTQVDAAAFAGATKFVGCNPLFDPAAANEAIKNAALAYAGDTTRDPATANVEPQTPNNTHAVINSDNWWTNGMPTDGTGFDYTQDTNGDGFGDPCNESALDVKGTDDNAPELFGFIPLEADPKRHARVEIHQILKESGMLPFAVPEVDPAAVFALFVNENGSSPATPYDWQQLMPDTAPPDSKFSYWTTSGGQENVNVPSENTSVVILISKNSTTPSTSGTLASICGQAPGLVRCYAGSSATSGVNFVHGWSDAPAGYLTVDGPKIRDVSVFSTCSDPSAPYFLNNADCDVGVTAKIDFGFPGDPTPNAPVGIKATAELYASATCGGSGDSLAWSGTSGTVSTWTGGGKTINAGSGRNPLSVEIHWKPGSGPGFDKCFELVAAPYAANDASGPLEYVDVEDIDQAPYPLIVDGNSRNIGNDHKFIVTIGLNKPIQITDPLDPPFLLRFASKSGSLNQALDCDAGIVFKDEIAKGCQTEYQLNYYDWDGDPSTPYTWHDINCSNYPSPSDLPPPNIVNDPTPDCVAAKTGDVNSFRQGLYERFFPNDTCTVNNWPKTAADVGPFFTNYDFANDPRYITLVITDFTAFTGSGAENVPVKYFAGFYATGWDVGPAGTGHDTACAYNDPHPLGLSSNKDNGDVWGHFVNIVLTSASGEPADPLCNFDQIGNCIAVLVE